MLFYGIVELAEGVAEFEAAGEELEALDVIRVVGLLLGERGDCGWVVVDDGRLDEVWLDQFLEKAIDHLAKRFPFRLEVMNLVEHLDFIGIAEILQIKRACCLAAILSNS